ncbi:MAG: sugar transferase [Cyclobacteriaceae bacterium]|nr:sugar transferase [Cyclobacteriaceae bacterium]UYN85584.1 MAG: sugar transferase [Cyclobacteriaceae bacterium]
MRKRLFDLVVSTVGLIILAPIFLLIGIIIKFDSQGPVFYLQERVGRGGTIFRLFKFRTMRTGSDKAAAITIGERDSRITTVGYWLRKFKLDELPQLINVWKGEMSLVGPRPELKKFVDLYSSDQRQVISVKPGITDYASIQFRNENKLLEGKEEPIEYYIREIMPVKLELNKKYILEQSFLLDVRIIFQTIVLIFKG